MQVEENYIEETDLSGLHVLLTRGSKHLHHAI